MGDGGEHGGVWVSESERVYDFDPQPDSNSEPIQFVDTSALPTGTFARGVPVVTRSAMLLADGGPRLVSPSNIIRVSALKEKKIVFVFFVNFFLRIPV